MADMIVKGVHGCSKEELYVTPKEPLIQERLEWFCDLKLGLFLTFGPYSQMGVDCSWPLSDEDAPWARKEVDWESDPELFRKQYFDMNKSFNPFRFQPDKWADFAVENGFKYLIFTTKHHDGFCMFDTKYSDYKITAPDCPFHTHKYANITREVFDAFRERGLAIAAYFSKPDWHCPWYWAKGADRPVGFNRNPTYTPSERPDLWNNFIEFTHNQLMELMTEYGKIDILWLDGGQVQPSTGQDIKLGELVAKARKIQPELITADRATGGENENFITPEQCVPDHVIRVPWESCVTVGERWIFSYDETYKSSRTLVHMLIETVSRGGNLALGVGPQPDGRLPSEAMKRLSGLGAWLKTNGDAIYGTRALDIPQIENVRYTKKGKVVYAMIPLAENEVLGETVRIPINQNVQNIRCLGVDGNIAFQKVENGVLVQVPQEIIGSCPYAVSFALE